MLKQICKYTILCIVLMVSNDLSAQTSDYPTPKWVSENGYWVIKSNIKLPLHHEVFFYNNENEIVGATEINYGRLKWKSKKFRMQLKAMLELYLFFNREDLFLPLNLEQ